MADDITVTSPQDFEFNVETASTSGSNLTLTVDTPVGLESASYFLFGLATASSISLVDHTTGITYVFDPVRYQTFGLTTIPPGVT